jgi:hypothetical protein
MAMTDLCPSCRETVDHPSGDGCAAMTRHQPHQCPSPEAIVRAALERIASGEFSGRMLTSMPPQDAAQYFARTTLAEMKGETND